MSLVKVLTGLFAAAVLSGGSAVAQTNVLPPAAPQTGQPSTQGQAASPNSGGATSQGLAQGVVPPPRNVDPEIVTPPPANVTPTMPVIKPPPIAK